MPDEKPNVLPIIGDVRGFFEVFLPGLFLLLHVALLVYCFAPTGPAAHFLSWLLKSGLGVATIIGLPLGYVLGLALRLGRTSYVDRLSVSLALRGTKLKDMHASAVEWLRTNEATDESESELNEILRGENLPYPYFMMAHVAESLPSESLDFYEDVWISEAVDEGDKSIKINLFRFNFFKILVAAVDERAAKDMFAAEMMVRHSAHMCAALCIAAATLVVSTLAIFLWHFCIPSIATWGLLCTLLLVAFLESVILFVGLLPNLRLLRISEAELVFSCCFRNRVTLQELIAKGR